MDGRNCMARYSGSTILENFFQLPETTHKERHHSRPRELELLISFYYSRGREYSANNKRHARQGRVGPGVGGPKSPGNAY